MCEASMIATALPHADESSSIFWKYAMREEMVLGTRCHIRARGISCASRRWSSNVREVSMRALSSGWMGGAAGMLAAKRAYMAASTSS